MTPMQASNRVVRNAMIILFMLTAVNTIQTFSILHHLGEINTGYARISREQGELDAVVNQLCLNMKTPCLYTLSNIQPDQPPDSR